MSHPGRGYDALRGLMHRGRHVAKSGHGELMDRKTSARPRSCRPYLVSRQPDLPGYVVQHGPSYLPTSPLMDQSLDSLPTTWHAQQSDPAHQLRRIKGRAGCSLLAVSCVLVCISHVLERVSQRNMAYARVVCAHRLHSCRLARRVLACVQRVAPDEHALLTRPERASSQPASCLGCKSVLPRIGIPMS